ncbi:unnamed protein product [Blumeria hordei]|uniref:Uncharacterized protein n=1 Tax=Blumeria hordei TaxID=2867405 RepID=A0A383UJ99_BLUHO|nr:unnamed protein product [Blumeria hordei]
MSVAIPHTVLGRRGLLAHWSTFLHRMINWRRMKGHRPHKHFLSRARASAKLNRLSDNFESFAEASITFGMIRGNGSFPTIVSNLHECQRRVLNPQL